MVETGTYHLELVPVPEADGIHLDLYLQTDGTQQAVPMEYDAAGEHFFAFFPSPAPREYKTVIQTDINGEKVNARFSFLK